MAQSHYSLWILFFISLSFHTLLTSASQYKTLNGELPIVIGHRGASGRRPGHTLESYTLAIELGADIVEPDLIMTKDGVLVCRHEPLLSKSTNVADLPEFEEKKVTKVVDGKKYTDWFAGDFTLAEIKKLKAIQNIPHRSMGYDNLFSIPTFDELIELVKTKSKELNITIGIYPETKRPTFHEESGLRLTDKLLETLTREGWNHYDAPVYVQSFEVSNLQYIRQLSTVKIMQLVGSSGLDSQGNILTKGHEGKPYDFIVHNDNRTYVDLVTDEGLEFVKSYADGVAVYKGYIVPYHFIGPNHRKAQDLNGDGKIDNRDYIRLPATDLIERAHKTGLLVHAYAFKDEVSTLLSDYQGHSSEEYKEFYNLGLDGLFSDFPDSALTARKAFQKKD